MASGDLAELEITACLRASRMGVAARVIEPAARRHGLPAVIGAILHVDALPGSSQVRSRGALLASLLRRAPGELTPAGFAGRPRPPEPLGEAEALAIARRLAPGHLPHWIRTPWLKTRARRGLRIGDERRCLEGFARKLQGEHSGYGGYADQPPARMPEASRRLPATVPIARGFACLGHQRAEPGSARIATSPHEEPAVMNRLWHLLTSTWAVAARLAEVTYRLVLMLTMLTFIGVAGTLATAFLMRPELPERMTLQISLPGTLSDLSGLSTVLSAFGGSPQPALFDLVDALHSAAEDPRVEAVVAELGEGPFDLAQNQAIAAALAMVRAAGKPTYAYTDSFGEMSPGYAAYHLASAFDEIWLQPVGQLAATGIALESRFYGDLLERLGVQPLFGYREEYKTAQHHLLFASSTGPQAEMMAALAADLQGQTAAEIAHGRKQTTEEIQRKVAGAPYSDREALELGLVDRLGYQDELQALMTQQHGEPVPVLTYLREMDRRHLRKNAPSIGLVPIDGQIARGSGTGASLLGGQMQGAASVARSIQQLAEQERIKAIILRVDSPGGSPAAAETIHRAVTQAQAKGKPVIVSMASIAGSGAYWLAAGADAIIAEPATLTGSIGVVGGKLDLSRLTAALGVATEQRAVAAHAGMWSMSRGYEPAELARRDELLDATYQTFLERVATGRGLGQAAVRELAKGRVWTGQQAHELGLVDRLGGLEDAIGEAKAQMGLPPEAVINLVRAGQTSGLPGLPALFGSMIGQLASFLGLELAPLQLRIMA